MSGLLLRIYPQLMMLLPRIANTLIHLDLSLGEMASILVVFFFFAVRGVTRQVND